MIRLRCGNAPARGWLCGGASLTSAAVRRHLVRQAVVFGRVDIHHAAGQDGDGASSGGQRAAMGRRVNAPGQAADDGQSRPGQPAGKPFGLPQAVLRAVPRADDADGQCVAGPQVATHEQHARRIVDLAERPRIGGVGLGKNLDAMLAAQGDLRLDVDVPLGRDDVMHEFRSDALHLAQVAGGRRQHRPGRPESLQKRLANPRPNARD